MNFQKKFQHLFFYLSLQPHKKILKSEIFKLLNILIKKIFE